MSVIQGGKFGAGFISAGFAKFATVELTNAGVFDMSSQDFGSVMGRTAVAAVVGGTASELGGGKFANGARTAAMAHLLNAEFKHKHTLQQTLRAMEDAYREEYGDLSTSEAKVALKAALSVMPKRAFQNESRFLDNIDTMNPAQLKVALRAAIVITYSGEVNELLGKVAIRDSIKTLSPRAIARLLIKEGHIDLGDVRENLSEGFDDFGPGAAARAGGLVSIKGASGGYAYGCAFRGACL